MSLRCFTCFLAAILLLTSIHCPADDHKDKWVFNWPDLQADTYMASKTMVLTGSFEGKRSHPFELKIVTKKLALQEIKKIQKARPERIYGENRNGDSAESESITELSLMLDGKGMDVPPDALYGIYNAKIGQSQYIRMNESDPTLIYLILSGPDGAESYEVAFIFSKKGFCRRQVQDPYPHLRKQLLEDRIFEVKK